MLEFFFENLADCRSFARNWIFIILIFMKFIWKLPVVFCSVKKFFEFCFWFLFDFLWILKKKIFFPFVLQIRVVNAFRTGLDPIPGTLRFQQITKQLQTQRPQPQTQTQPPRRPSATPNSPPATNVGGASAGADDSTQKSTTAL